jgi:hypothetical protein
MNNEYLHRKNYIKIFIFGFNNGNWVDSTSGGLIFLECIICTVVCTAALKSNEGILFNIYNKVQKLSWSHHSERCTVDTMTWVTVSEYLCHKWPRICSLCLIHNPVFSWLINGSKMAGVTRGASGSHRMLVGFVLLDLLFSVFVDRCWSFCLFFFGYCIVYPSSIYGFWLPLYCLQTFPIVELRFFVECLNLICLYIITFCCFPNCLGLSTTRNM